METSIPAGSEGSTGLVILKAAHWEVSHPALPVPNSDPQCLQWEEHRILCIFSTPAQSGTPGEQPPSPTRAPHSTPHLWCRLGVPLTILAELWDLCPVRSSVSPLPPHLSTTSLETFPGSCSGLPFRHRTQPGSISIPWDSCPLSLSQNKPKAQNLSHSRFSFSSRTPEPCLAVRSRTKRAFRGL